MFRNQELARLLAYKQKLLAQSEANRAQLAATWEHLRGPASTLERGIGFLRETRFLWMLAAPVLGFFAARKWRTLGRISTSAVAGWRMVRKFYSIWQSIRRSG